jgi:DNA-binding CsgD family transcriptional regulator
MKVVVFVTSYVRACWDRDNTGTRRDIGRRHGAPETRETTVLTHRGYVRFASYLLFGVVHVLCDIVRLTHAPRRFRACRASCHARALGCPNVVEQVTARMTTTAAPHARRFSQTAAYSSFDELARGISTARTDSTVVQNGTTGVVGSAIFVDGNQHRIESMHVARSSEGSVRVVVVSLGAVAKRSDDNIEPAAFGLTPRQTQIAELLGARRTNLEIANTLGISCHTVRNHVQQILSKANVRSRRDLGLSFSRRSINA